MLGASRHRTNLLEGTRNIMFPACEVYARRNNRLHPLAHFLPLLACVVDLLVQLLSRLDHIPNKIHAVAHALHLTVCVRKRPDARSRAVPVLCLAKIGRCAKLVGLQPAPCPPPNHRLHPVATREQRVLWSTRPVGVALVVVISKRAPLRGHADQAPPVHHPAILARQIPLLGDLDDGVAAALLALLQPVLPLQVQRHRAACEEQVTDRVRDVTSLVLCAVVDLIRHNLRVLVRTLKPHPHNDVAHADALGLSL
mmetsp:Transcript_40615/g.99759  ORF Transcript_40615/g.99759 Transcript_40615/m.99759 type:complete len:254 (-) Transcript_40615:324-1085(-)